MGTTAIPEPVRQGFTKSDVTREESAFEQQLAEAVARFHCSDHELEEAFHDLVREWYEDTLLESSLLATLTHPAFYKIIGLGERVLPLVFKELNSGRGYWFVALEALTRENPVPPGATSRQAREAWITWGIEHDLIR